MRHIIFGGDGFLGTDLTQKLAAKGEHVLVLDINKNDTHGNYAQPNVTHEFFDVTKKEQFENIEVTSEDVVYHFAARLLVPILPRAERQDYFWQSLYVGTENVLEFMRERGLRNMVYYTTDMVYGRTKIHPRKEDHPCEPLGPYGEAKYQTEKLCQEFRDKHNFNITLFRPRLIIGPGRLGILEKLFKLVDKNLPVPTIGNGKNYYQFISVDDCSEACLAAVEKGFPNENFNLGSENPPTVNELLGGLIKEAKSKSLLIPTPAFAVKFVLDILDRLGIPLMDPEQYLIADETCVLDCQKASDLLGWKAKDGDTDMLLAAYSDYRKVIDGGAMPKAAS